MSDKDVQLVQRCLAGEQAAFERLDADHAGRVLAYFLRSGFARHDAEDMAQETFIRAFRSLHTFDAGRGRFHPWLATIARNVARKHWSRRKAPENFDPELAEEMFADSVNPGPDPASAEEIVAVGRCVDSLPADLVRVVRLRYIDARTTRGIAAEMNLPESTVRLRLKEAAEAVRQCLKEKGFLE
ncbi:MAG: sigma-70 family RNA polymerase sigma factor [Planctomycetota bacterium]|nr:sigma-70 family RNA polymerase sigma factor [Planctomycetota bacterium]